MQVDGVNVGAVITRIQRPDSRAPAGCTLVAHTCLRHWQSIGDSYLTVSRSHCWYLAWHSSCSCTAWLVNLKLDLFLRGRRHAAGRRRAARGRRPLRRSVLRLIANMTFKLFLHCLVCELEVDFFCVNFFFLRCRRRGTAAQDHGDRNQRQPAANQVISHVTSQNRVISQLCGIT